MFDHAMRRGLLPLAAAIVLAGCHDAPTLPPSRVAPQAAAASIAPPAGTFPVYQQSIWLIVDEHDNEIWQNVTDAPLTGGYFTLATAPAGAELAPCELKQFSFKQIFCIDAPFHWETSIFFFQCVPDDLYPIAMWVSSNPSCFGTAYNPVNTEVLAGQRAQVIAAPTAPGGLVFRRWEVRIGGELLPCAEGAGSPTCTVTFTQAYPHIGPTYKLVYGNQYPFTGFFSPVDNAPTVNVVKAGSSIPVKFSLGGNRGLGILASGSPASVQVACDLAAASDDVETTVTAGGSSLTYNATADQYTYVWKTEKSWAGTCREFRLTLDDETVHVATFRFSK